MKENSAPDVNVINERIANALPSKISEPLSLKASENVMAGDARRGKLAVETVCSVKKKTEIGVVTHVTYQPY